MRGPRGRLPPKPASSVIPDFCSGKTLESNPQAEWAKPSRGPSASTCEPYREVIQLGLDQGRTAKAIWQDLVDRESAPPGYSSLRRFARQLRSARSPEAHPVIVTVAGEEAQVDYGEGPMVRDPDSGRYRRTRLFVMTLGYSRKCVRWLVWHSSARIWAEPLLV